MRKKQDSSLQPSAKSSGQALIEYALILALIALALAAIMATTSRAVGNVFSNTVYNLVGQDPDEILPLEQAGGADYFWQTVTWVARNPIEEEPFPTREQVPTTNPTPGPSPTPRPTRPTDTPSPTATFTVSPTADDTGFNLPFVEDVDDDEVQLRWRLDNSLYLGGSAWFGEYFPNNTFTAPAAYSLWNWQHTSARDNTFHLDFDWGTGDFPISAGSIRWPNPRNQAFSIRYTREIHLDAPETLRFNAFAADGIRVLVNGSPIIDEMNPSAELRDEIYTADASLGAGMHTVVVEYAEYDGGLAGLGLEITLAGGGDGQINADDNVDEGNSDSRCNWGRINNRNSESLEWMFDPDPRVPAGENGAAPGVTCHLELRGFIDADGATNPVLTFWDVWDFTGSSAAARVQVGRYVEDTNPSPVPPNGAPVLDRGAVSWTTYDIHTTADANYEWTRQEIDLSAFAGEEIILRFIIENAGSSGYRRWYIDNIRVEDVDTSTTEYVTMGDLWELNNSDERDDFVTTARWRLTSEIIYGIGGLSFDDSPNYSTDPFTEPSLDPSADPSRVHYIELKDWIDLSPANYDPLNDADLEGDVGDPILSFWHSFNVADGTIIQAEWTRDARDDLTTSTNPTDSDNWQRIGTTPIVDNTAGTANTVDWRTMQIVEVPLTEIPDWNVSPFRLRLAMYVDEAAAPGNDDLGWHVDQIYLERTSQEGFAPYPFIDDVESQTFAAQNWFFIGWGRTGTQSRRSTASYADSPAGNYRENTNNRMELRNPLDLNNDSPNVILGGSGNYAETPNNPMLSFWHLRDLNSGATFHVDLYNPVTDTWASVWDYTWGDSVDPISADVQLAWERVEIDLIPAFEQAFGVSWSTITSNGDVTDDDINIAFRLENIGTVVADGVYVDDIRIEDRVEEAWHLWPEGDTHAGEDGDGTTYLLDLENGDWRDDWHTGGDWDRTDENPRSGLRLIEDSPEDEDYRADTISILELDRVIDLRGVEESDEPVLYFWMRYDIDSSDELEVHITERNSGSTVIDYDRMYGWEAWDDEWPGNRQNANKYSDDRRYAEYQRINTGWHRTQIDLEDYAGEEIRVRFVVESISDDANLADGWFLDNIRFTYRSGTRIFNLAFVDLAQGTGNWVTEGDWGLALDFWKDTGGGPAQLGSNPWIVRYANCERIEEPPFSDSDPWNYAGMSSCASNADHYNTLADWATGELVDPNTGLVIPASGEWLFETTVNDPLVLFFGNGRPTGDWNWNDEWVAHITRRVRIEQFSTYTFQTIADDAARAKIVGPIGAPPNQQVNPGDDWNIVNLWGPFPGGPVQSTNSITLPPGEYDLVIDWAEVSSQAFLSFTVANNNFSFTDSPNTPNQGGGFDIVESQPFSDTALVLDGVLDLRTAGLPVMEYYAHWDHGSDDNSTTRAFTRIEYSENGGFSWSDWGLGDDISGPGGTTSMDGSYYDDVNNFFNNGWRLRRHNLWRAAGSFTMIRFRTVVRSDDPQWNGDGFYFTELRVNAGTGATIEDLLDVDALYLIDSVSDARISTPLNETGEVIDLSDTPFITFEAETFPIIDPGSLRFEWTMTPANGDPVETGVQTENNLPYSMTGDNPAGNFHPFEPIVPGTLEIVVTLYDGGSGSGNAGPSRTYTFTVVD